MTQERSVHDPVAVEQKIEETKNRIAAGVKIVTGCEKELKAKKRAFDLAYAYAYKNGEGSIKDREYTADIQTMPHREEADNAVRDSRREGSRSLVSAGSVPLRTGNGRRWRTGSGPTAVRGP